MPELIAVVPARLASTRLPRKMLADLGGQPLIVRVCENLLASQVFERVLVATDHADIARAVAPLGIEAVLTDPRLPSGTDRVAAAAHQLGLSGKTLLVNVQGDEPFVAHEALHTVAQGLRDRPNAVSTLVEPLVGSGLRSDANVVKVALGAEQRALYFSRSSIPYARDPEVVNASPWAFRHVGVYAYSVATLTELARLEEHPLEQHERLEQLRWLAHGYTILAHLVEPGLRGVDSAADLAAANDHYRASFREY